MRKIEIILKALTPLPARVYSIFARKFIFLFLVDIYTART